MRELVNINPELTSEILNKSGLVFDGYYYTNANVPFQLRNDEDGYSVTMKDPGLPPLPIKLVKYSDLIAFLNSALQFALEDAIQKGQLVISNGNYKALSKFVHDWWVFDSDLHYMVVNNEAGIAMIPNDEYTFSLTNGSIMEFEVEYSVDDQNASIKLECTPQCISWPFLMKYIKEVKGISDESRLKIIECNITKADGDKTPFFGIGITKVDTSRL